MQTLAVYFVLYTIMATVTRCDTKLKLVPSHRKESSTTFLRLTALRDDEGLWIARFGEYEISIELKRHSKFAVRKDAEDTWTLKIKHMSKRFQIPENDVEVFYNNEVTMDNKSSQANKGSCQQITDTKNTDVEYVDNPTYSKFPRSGRSRKGKSRRQLSTKSHLKNKRNTTAALEVTVIQPTSQQPPIFKELVQGKKELLVAFDRTANDTSQVAKTDKAFQELDETPWGNVSAVMLESTENHTLPLENTQTNQEEISSTESNIDDGDEKFFEPYALPLQQSEDGDESEAGNRTTSLEETNEKEAFHEFNWTTETGQRSEGMDVAEYEERNSGNFTKGADVAEISNEEQHTDNWTDYVIEDTTVREYDKEDVECDERENNYDSIADGRGDFEPTSEMKRIIDWFPRSKLLTTENNGYKLFPGVGWFKLITWPERWSNARDVCELEEAHLAVPDTKQKVRVFLQIFKNYPDVLEQTILHKQVYVGVYSSGQDRNFSTVLGNPFSPKFPIWFPNEPDNADPGEECVTFHAEGKIRDVPCFYSLPFLCEKELDHFR